MGRDGVAGFEHGKKKGGGRVGRVGERPQQAERGMTTKIPTMSTHIPRKAGKREKRIWWLEEKPDGSGTCGITTTL